MYVHPNHDVPPAVVPGVKDVPRVLYHDASIASGCARIRVVVAKLQADPWTEAHNSVYVHSNHITITAGAHDTMNAPKVLDNGASIAVGCA